MNQHINVDDINIDYHIKNFAFFYDNYIKNNKFLFNIFNTNKNNYFINFQAFYYFNEEILKNSFNFFINVPIEDFKKNIDYAEVSIEDFHFKNNYSCLVKKLPYINIASSNRKELINFVEYVRHYIKDVIIKQNSYISICNNFKYFKFLEVIDCFKKDDSIIHFLKNFPNLEKNIESKKLFEHLITDVVFHRQHLFEECFQNFNFDSVEEKFLICLIDNIGQKDHLILHNFSKYAKLKKTLIAKIEKIIFQKEVINF